MGSSTIRYIDDKLVVDGVCCKNKRRRMKDGNVLSDRNDVAHLLLQNKVKELPRASFLIKIGTIKPPGSVLALKNSISAAL